MSDIFHKSVSCSEGAAAALGGLGKSLLGLFGMGELASGDDKTTQDLQDAQKAFNDAKEAWNETIADEKYKIQEDQLGYLQELMNYGTLQESLINETLSESVGKNTILIYMLVVLVFFLIVFDITS